MFDQKLLKRDRKLLSYLKRVGDSIECTKPIMVLFPSRYLDIGFAKIEMGVECLGVNMVMTEDHIYEVSTLPNMIRYLPTEIDEIEIEGKMYTRMKFDKNFIESTDTIDMADPVFEELVEFFMKGNVPFFLEKDDIMKLFEKSARTTSKDIGKDPIPISMLIAVTARDESGTTEVRLKNGYKGKIRWVSMINADLAYNNNLSRTMGSYQDRGMTAALNDDDPNVTEMEQIFRR